jgi:hypothetical protein
MATMVNHQKGPQRGHAPQTGHANYTTVEGIPRGEEVLVGTFFLNEHPVIIYSTLEHHMTLWTPPVLKIKVVTCDLGGAICD